METIKVSFDFDGVLDRPDVQRYAKSLIRRGIEVWICTARLDNDQCPNQDWNKDLFKTAKSIGIKPYHIKFCPVENKYKFFKNGGFLFHLDDDPDEINEINENTDVCGIFLSNHEDWLQNCENSIKYKTENSNYKNDK